MVKTYPEMNEGIKNILSFGCSDTEEYALARIVELEKQNEQYKQILTELMSSEEEQLEGYESDHHKKIREALGLTIEEAFGEVEY